MFKTYAECVEDIIKKKPGMTRRDIAGLVGIDESVLSKRMSKTKATHEALIVINTVRDVVCAGTKRQEHFRSALRQDRSMSGAYWGAILRAAAA